MLSMSRQTRLILFRRRTRKGSSHDRKRRRPHQTHRRRKVRHTPARASRRSEAVHKKALGHHCATLPQPVTTRQRLWSLVPPPGARLARCFRNGLHQAHRIDPALQTQASCYWLRARVYVAGRCPGIRSERNGLSWCPDEVACAGYVHGVPWSQG